MHPARKAFTRRKPRMVPCKICKEPFPRERMSQVVCGVLCAITHDQALKAKAMERKRQRDARETKARKAALDTPQQIRSKAIRAAESAVRWYVRERDRGNPCISCGATVEQVESGPYRHGGYWDAGHFLGKGSQPALRLNALNINKQCKSCNGGTNSIRHSGTAKAESVKAGYERRLAEKIGQDLVDWLNGPHEPLKADLDYLKRIQQIFNKRARRIIRIRGYE